MRTAAAPASPAPAANEPEAGLLWEVAPGVHLLRMPMPFRLDHINLYVLEDPSGWTLVDCGLNTPETVALWDALFENTLGDRPVARIIVTHLHPDHIGLAHWLRQKTGAPVFMTREEFDMAQRAFELPISDPAHLSAHYRRLGLEGESLEAMVRQAGGYRKLIKTLPDGVAYYQGGEDITIGSRRWRVMLGRGHSPRSICLWSEADGMLIGGDHVLPAISPNVNLLSVGPQNPLEDYLGSLEEFGRLPCTWLLPAHGAPSTDFSARVEYLRGHHDEHLSELESFCREPRTAADCVPLLFGDGLPDHQRYFAIGEAAAHLVYLAAQGRVARAGDVVWTFSKT